MHTCLPRLAPAAYRAQAAVHWIMSIEGRNTGWLRDRFHLRFREVMLHALTRHELMCPAYCLMPDHAHIVWVGCAPKSDQRLAIRFLRAHTSPLLAPYTWQQQPYDHVLRENERGRDALASVCHYVVENPVRRALAEKWHDYPFSGAMIPGFPSIDPRLESFEELFWKTYNERAMAYLGRTTVA